MSSTVLETLEIQLSMEDGQFVTRVSRAGRALSQFGNQATTSASALDRIASATDGVAAKMRHFVVTMSLVRGALHNIWAGVGQWQMAIIKTNQEIERTIALMKALSTKGTTGERDKEASDNLAFMLELAQKVPFSLGAIQDAFVKLKTAGIDPTNGSLKSLLNAVAASGGSEQQLHRAAVAIQQMGAKGVISMEELRQQLAEAVPQAFTMLAQSLGVSTQELSKRIASGSVEAQGALQLLFKEFERTYGSAGILRMQTWDGLVAKFTTRWMLFQKAIGDAGYYDNVKKKMGEIIEALDPAKVAEFASQISRALEKTLDALWALGKGFVEYWDLIKHGLETVGVFYIAYKMRLIQALMWTRKAIWQQIVALGAQTTAYLVTGKAATTAAAGTTILGQGVKFLTVRITALFRLMRMNAWGILLSALAAVAAYFFTMETAADKLEDKIESLKDGLVAFRTEADKMAARDAMIAQNDKVQNLRAYQNAVTYAGDNAGRLSKLKSQYSEEFKLYKNNLAMIGEALAAAKKEEEEMRENFRKSEAAADDLLARQEVEKMQSKLAQQEMNARTQYMLANQLAKEKLDAHKIDQKEYLKLRTEALDAQKKALIAFYNVEREYLVKARDDARLVGDQDRITATVAAIAQLDKQIEEIGNEKMDDQSKLGALMGEGGVKKLSMLQNYMVKIRAETEAFNEEVNGGVFAAEKFAEMARAGKFDTKTDRLSADPKRIAALQAEVDAWVKAGNAAKGYRQDIKDNDDAVENLHQWEAKLNAELTSINEQMESGALQKQTSGMRSLEKAIAGMKEKMDPKTVEEFLGAFDGLRKAQGSIDSANLELEWMNKVMEQGKELASSDKERLEVTIALERELLMARMAQLGTTDEMRSKIVDLFDKWAAGATKVAAKQMPLQEMFKRWADTATQVSDVWVGAFEGMADALTEFVMTGKLNFGDLVRSVIAGLIKIQIQTAMMDMFNLFSLGGGGGGGGGSPGEAVPGGVGPSFAKGGVMSGYGSRSLKRYARGGIAHKPQLAMFGEGTKPEAYVPLPDGRTIPVSIQGGMQGAPANVEVNVINQTSNEVTAETKGPRWNGEQMILDVILKAANRPGGFRDGLRGAVVGN